MDNEKVITGFLAISELYFKLVENTEKIVTINEVESLISNVNNSNLTIFNIEKSISPRLSRRG